MKLPFHSVILFADIHCLVINVMIGWFVAVMR